MMSDLIYTVETAARDPLVGGFALMVAGVLISRMLFKQRPDVAGCCAGYIPGASDHPVVARWNCSLSIRCKLTGAPYHDTIAGTLKIAWWLWAAWFLVGFVRAVVIFERRPLDGRLVQDILCPDLPDRWFRHHRLCLRSAHTRLGGHIWRNRHHSRSRPTKYVERRFSGLVLSLGHPYRPGDQVKFEGGTEGKIVEMNWRATHVLTARQISRSFRTA